MKELIGKKILRVLVDSETQQYLVFETDKGKDVYETYGDCCSETWFADITGVDALIGGTVQEVRQNPLEGYNVEDGRTRQESDSAYGETIVTEKGHCDIVYRNSSNGYYGGDISHIEEIPKKVLLRELTSDYAA
jgi:hypothetical protein